MILLRSCLTPGFSAHRHISSALRYHFVTKISSWLSRMLLRDPLKSLVKTLFKLSITSSSAFAISILLIFLFVSRVPLFRSIFVHVTRCRHQYVLLAISLFSFILHLQSTQTDSLIGTIISGHRSLSESSRGSVTFDIDLFARIYGSYQLIKLYSWNNIFALETSCKPVPFFKSVLFQL